MLIHLLFIPGCFSKGHFCTICFDFEISFWNFSSFQITLFCCNLIVQKRCNVIVVCETIEIMLFKEYYTELKKLLLNLLLKHWVNLLLLANPRDPQIFVENVFWRKLEDGNECSVSFLSTLEEDKDGRHLLLLWVATGW